MTNKKAFSTPAILTSMKKEKSVKDVAKKEKIKLDTALADTAPEHKISGPETAEEVRERRKGRGPVRGSRLQTALSSATLGG